MRLKKDKITFIMGHRSFGRFMIAMKNFKLFRICLVFQNTAKYPSKLNMSVYHF
jgi:hypothetical protein